MTSAPAASTPAAGASSASTPAATSADTTGTVPPAGGQPANSVAKIDIPTDIGPVALRDAAAGGDAKALFEIGAGLVIGRIERFHGSVGAFHRGDGRYRLVARGDVV
ncbi:hypothetical protein EN859_036410, partial [Mesorhizobium sp. M00.F.Ca.ET.216.01.1.1]